LLKNDVELQVGVVVRAADILDRVPLVAGRYDIDL